MTIELLLNKLCVMDKMIKLKLKETKIELYYKSLNKLISCNLSERQYKEIIQDMQEELNWLDFILNNADDFGVLLGLKAMYALNLGESEIENKALPYFYLNKLERDAKELVKKVDFNRIREDQVLLEGKYVKVLSQINKHFNLQNQIGKSEEATK